MNNVKKEKLLILSGSLGAGHVQAARAIVEASALYKPGVEVKVVDFMEWIHPRMHVVERYCFLQWVKHFPASYSSYLYQMTRTDSRLTLLLKHLGAASQQRLLRLLNDEQPSMVVSTFPSAAAAISLLKEKGKSDLPTATVITDHSDHSYWIQPSTDLYLVGSAGMRAALQRKGVADHKIAVTGIPVSLSCKEDDNRERLREKMGWALDTFVVLVMGGGSGIYDKLFIEHLRAGLFPPQFQFIIVCGHNVKLLHRLHEVLGDRDNVMLTGFLEGIHEWMAAADVLITKPGGLTTSEAMAFKLPMLLLEPRLGQEKDNADYLIEAGLAYLCRVDKLEDQLQQLAHQPSLLNQMREKAGLCRQQDSARLAVIHIMNTLGAAPILKERASLQKYA